MWWFLLIRYLLSFFLFYLFIFHHLPPSFSLIRIPVRRSAVLSEWLKQAKYERHKGWMKFLELETFTSLWRKSAIALLFYHLKPFFKNLTMLDTSSWLHASPAHFGSAPISRGVKKQAIRLDRERRACLSLREGVESCCMCAFTPTNIRKAFSKRLKKNLRQLNFD